MNRVKTVYVHMSTPRWRDCDRFLYRKYGRGSYYHNQRKEWKKEYNAKIRHMSGESSGVVKITFLHEKEYVAWMLRWS